jgi:hypothetical protein
MTISGKKSLKKGPFNIEGMGVLDVYIRIHSLKILMKLVFMCSCGNLPKSPFLQSHLELSSLRLSAFWTTILLCFQNCIKKKKSFW